MRPGVGLAAPQIGLSLQLAVIEDTAESDATNGRRSRSTSSPTRAWSWAPEIVEFYEGCLSVEGFQAIVPRARAVRVDALDHRGEPVSSTRPAGTRASCSTRSTTWAARSTSTACARGRCRRRATSRATGPACRSRRCWRRWSQSTRARPSTSLAVCAGCSRRPARRPPRTPPPRRGGRRAGRRRRRRLRRRRPRPAPPPPRPAPAAFAGLVTPFRLSLTYRPRAARGRRPRDTRLVDERHRHRHGVSVEHLRAQPPGLAHQWESAAASLGARLPHRSHLARLPDPAGRTSRRRLDLEPILTVLRGELMFVDGGRGCCASRAASASSCRRRSGTGS